MFPKRFQNVSKTFFVLNSQRKMPISGEDSKRLDELFKKGEVGHLKPGELRKQHPCFMKYSAANFRNYFHKAKARVGQNTMVTLIHSVYFLDFIFVL